MKIEIENLCRSYATADDGGAAGARGANGAPEAGIHRAAAARAPSAAERKPLPRRAAAALPVQLGQRHRPPRHHRHRDRRRPHRPGPSGSDRRRSDKYVEAAGYEPQRLGDSDYFRVVLKEEDLDYIFARIELLK
ncbi:MAG: hypothetical protein MZV70_60110 [Desulfobacterales bacterium]|nr:hypothetical protein [Desulfobacterales bacterium]